MDGCRRRPGERDARTDDEKSQATNDEANGRPTMSGGLPYGLQSMLKVRETTRRDGRAMDEWMEWNGWMTRWGRDEDDDRWLEGERGTGGVGNDRVGGVSTRVGREDGE